MKYRALYQKGSEKLHQAGIAEAGLDARLLLEFLCGTNQNDMFLHGDGDVSLETERQYNDLILRRAEHFPLQYLTNQQEFMGLSFYVNEHVLIPRQDTEILVETIMKDRHDGKRILEIGTGSGCIILSLLKYSNSCQGTATDISREALAVAQKNAAKLGLDVEFILTDLAADIRGKYDMIVSNPPYIESGGISSLMPEVREHEPISALDGGVDGLDFYRRILKETPHLLAPGGAYYFEVGYLQADAVLELMAYAGCTETRVVRDYAGIDRVVCGFL